MLKIFLTTGILCMGLFGVVLAHGTAEEMMSGDEAMMKMDDMMGGMMMERKDFACAAADSHHLMDAGEEMMEKMLAGDKEKHEKIEDVMEAEGGKEFHDMLHMMMGRTASGCFSDEEQNLIAAKLGTEIPQASANQLPALAGGVVIGLILGAVIIPLFRKTV